LILRAKQEGLALPAGIAPGTPMSDVTKTGDTFYANELLDNVLVSRDGIPMDMISAIRCSRQFTET
jgi:monoterpene epsilon-lactone hydrolase